MPPPSHHPPRFTLPTARAGSNGRHPSHSPLTPQRPAIDPTPSPPRALHCTRGRLDGRTPAPAPTNRDPGGPRVSRRGLARRFSVQVQEGAQGRAPNTPPVANKPPGNTTPPACTRPLSLSHPCSLALPATSSRLCMHASSDSFPTSPSSPLLLPLLPLLHRRGQEAHQDPATPLPGHQRASQADQGVAGWVLPPQRSWQCLSLGCTGW